MAMVFSLAACGDASVPSMAPDVSVKHFRNISGFFYGLFP
ncbi:MAG: hypothetical protein Ct9H300mP28_17970 [Pseudomonadota bacterium]|nr:MAG: hypothetical protein Ct9H300mP28_17970 [Pseudomonadota bacterium]